MSKKKKRKKKKQHKKHKFVHKISESKKSDFKKLEKEEKIDQTKKAFKDQNKKNEDSSYKAPYYFKKDIRFIFILAAILLVVMTGLLYLINNFRLFDPLFKWLKLG